MLRGVYDWIICIVLSIRRIRDVVVLPYESSDPIIAIQTAIKHVLYLNFTNYESITHL